MNATMNQTVRLALESESDCERAARFIAQLVREGVTFTATQINNNIGVEIMLVEFTGGY